MTTLKNISFIFLLGMVGSYAHAPYSVWPLMFISLGGFYYFYANAPTAKHAAITGFTFALGYFTAGLWWIGNALLVDGNEFWWVWPLAVIGLPALLSFFTGVYTGAAFSLSNPKRLSGFFIFCLCLGLSEWVRGHIFTGFPWNLYGYIWSNTLPIAQAASVVGAYGLTLLTLIWATTTGFVFAVYFNASPAKAGASNKQDPRFRGEGKIGIFLSLIFLSFIICALWGKWRLDHHPTAYHNDITLHVVQPNIPQDMKWDATLAVRHFEKQITLSQNKDKPSNQTHLIIWPETAVSLSFLYNPSARSAIQNMLGGYGTQAYLLSGILDKKAGYYYNGVGVFDTNGNMTPVYSKTHLVPFGEYIPFQKYIPIKPLVEFSGFEKGSGPTSVTYNKHIPPFSPMVCYEIIFPAAVAPRTPRPEWILNVTNDAWYGDSAGPHQHMVHAIFRAIEEGLPVVRSANTGVSVVVDPLGRILSQSKIYTDDVLTISLPLSIQKTVY